MPSRADVIPRPGATDKERFITLMNLLECVEAGVEAEAIHQHGLELILERQRRLRDKRKKASLEPIVRTFAMRIVEVKAATRAFEEELKMLKLEKRKVEMQEKAAEGKQAELEESRDALEHVTEADQRTLMRTRPRAARKSEVVVNTSVVNMDTIGMLRGRPISVATFASAEQNRDEGDEVGAVFEALMQMTGETDLGMLAKHLIFASKAQQLAGFNLEEVEARRNSLQKELAVLDEELEKLILAGVANITKRAHIDEIERRLKRAHHRYAYRMQGVQYFARMLAPVTLGMEIISRKIAVRKDMRGNKRFQRPEDFCSLTPPQIALCVVCRRVCD